ncbi:MAG: DoxX family protein [Patescibacteria group bacterium]
MRKFFENHKDLGILILRVGIGISFILYGWAKIQGGEEVLIMLGNAMAKFGITFAPKFWGTLAVASEFVGGIFLILGLLTRPAAAIMAFTMLIAVSEHIAMGDPVHIVMHPVELFTVFVSLVFIGAGKYSIDALICKKK